MSLVAIINAENPICLEKMLGDTILEWQLYSLPEELGRIMIIAGNNHEKVSSAFAGPKISCYQNLKQAKLELTEEDHTLFIMHAQPFISTVSIRLLLSYSCGVLFCGKDHSLRRGPVYAPWSQFLEDCYSQSDDFSTLTSEINVFMCKWSNLEDFFQVNTWQDIAKAQGIAKKNILERWLKSGVAISAPESVFIGPRVNIAFGATIEPQACIEGDVTIGTGSIIGQGCVIRNANIGKNAEIRPYCVINGAVIGDNAKVGPFANLREGTRLDADVRIGNFVETKKAHLRSGSKANHLSYLGDCEIGERTNIGAGCITCNYDGFSKHQTLIGKDVFVGSDCQLVAPVTVGEGAILAAGTTLTTNVPENALILTRPVTKILEGAAKKLRARQKTTNA
jgi:bifunctional N-acetylglucosamine-1-phosphate-uridyltransferase/glucosamine-1-phosphate-acetyltransferase GlmU-like protein